MRKPIILTIYGSYERFRTALIAVPATFTERDILSEFWGKEFRIEYPTGKGANQRLRRIFEIKENKI